MSVFHAQAKLVANGEVKDVQDDLGRGDWKRQHVVRKVRTL